MPNYIVIPDELDLWEQSCKIFKGAHPSNVSATLKTLIFPGIENIQSALRILETLPMTSCEYERSCHRLKYFNRSIMRKKRLNGLDLRYVNKDIEPNVNEVLTKFSKQNPRRLELLYK